VPEKNFQAFYRDDPAQRTADHDPVEAARTSPPLTCAQPGKGCSFRLTGN
jgi:hypothetical protein